MEGWDCLIRGLLKPVDVWIAIFEVYLMPFWGLTKTISGLAFPI